MPLQPATKLIVPRLHLQGVKRMCDDRRSTCLASKLADRRKLQSAGGGMGAHGALRAVKHHCGARGRAAARYVRAKPLGLFFGP